MKKTFSMSYFNAPIAPVKDTYGRLLLRATTTPAGILAVEQVFRMITSDSRLHQLTREVRSAPDRRAAKQSLLPYVTPCGVFAYRSTAHLTGLSGLLPIDIDHLDTPGEAVEMRQLLFDDPVLRPVLCFISPGGLGVKAFVPYHVPAGEDPVRCASESIYWAMAYVQTLYGPTGKDSAKGVDLSGKDLVRTCFLCHDADALLRTDEIEY